LFLGSSKRLSRPPAPVLPTEVMATVRLQRDAARSAPKPRTALHMVLAIDDAYAPHAGVTIASALAHARAPALLHVHILEDGSLSETSRARLTKIAETGGGTLSFHPVEDAAIAALPLNRSYISKATYYRLVMLKALPGDISRIIYIDADTVVTDALEALWAADLDGHPIGACADEGGLAQSRRLGLDPGHIYFNAGVAVFDLAALRKMEFEAKASAAYAAHADKITLQDQDILNIVFCGQTKLLDLRWNANTRLYVGSDLEAAYSKAEAQAAAAAPGILHFTDKRKPWTLKELNPMGVLYWDYRNQGPWAETFAQRHTRRLIKAFRHLFGKRQRALNAHLARLKATQQ